MRRLFILLTVFSHLLAPAQNTITKQIEKNINQSNELLKTDHTQAFNYAKKAVDYSKSGTADDKIKSISNFITILIEKGDFPTAHQYLLVLKYLSEQNDSKKGLFDYYLHNSSVLIQEGFYKDAEKAIDSSFFIARQYNFKDTGQLIYNLAQIDIAALKIKPALIKLDKAYNASSGDITLMRMCKICQVPYTGVNSKINAATSGLDTIISNLKKENNLFILGQLYGMIGGGYLLNFNFPLAVKNYKIADEYFEKINSPFYQASNMLAWSQALAMQSKNDSALLLSRIIIQKFEKLNYKLGLSLAHMYAGSFYNKLKDTANAKKHRELSEKYNKESKISIIRANNMLESANEKKGSNKNKADETVNKAIKLLTEFTRVNPGLIKISVYQDSTNNTTILKNLENLVNEIDFVKDSITQKKNSDALQELETRYKTSQKNDSLQIQKQQLALKETQLKLKETQRQNLKIGITIVGGFALLIGFLLFVLYNQKKKLIIEKRAVVNLTGILKHETSRQFGNLKTSIIKTLKSDKPKQQVSKALTLVKTYEMLYNNLFISDGLATISLKNAFQKIFEYHCDDNSSLTPTLTISGGEDIIFNNSDYLFQYMNELMANSFEHAFTGIENPVIDIGIVYKKPTYEITYRDNGIGFSEEQIKTIQGKGLYYLRSYATQNLNGTLEINGQNGAEYKLTFNENNI